MSTGWTRKRALFLGISAALLLVEAYADRHTEGRWNVVINRKGEAFLDLMGRPNPSMTRFNTKTQSAAKKSIARIASEIFSVELEPYKQTGKACPRMTLGTAR